MQTAISNIKYIIPKNVIIPDVRSIDPENADPRSPIKIWPVLKLAVKRTANVIGRIILLISSIIQRKGFNTAGDPEGWKCAKKEVKLNEAPIIIIEIHRGNERAKLIARCLDEEKIYGVRPIKLRKIKVKKIAENEDIVPAKFTVWVRDTNSWVTLDKVKL